MTSETRIITIMNPGSWARKPLNDVNNTGRTWLSGPGYRPSVSTIFGHWLTILR